MFSLVMTDLKKKKAEACRFIKHLKNLVASIISYVTINHSNLGPAVCIWLVK